MKSNQSTFSPLAAALLHLKSKGCLKIELLHGKGDHDT